MATFTHSDGKQGGVWFPVTETGEPVERNPDDGFGGALYKMTNVREFDLNEPSDKYVGSDQRFTWTLRSLTSIATGGSGRLFD